MAKATGDRHAFVVPPSVALPVTALVSVGPFGIYAFVVNGLKTASLQIPTLVSKLTIPIIQLIIYKYKRNVVSTIAALFPKSAGSGSIMTGRVSKDRDK